MIGHGFLFEQQEAAEAVVTMQDWPTAIFVGIPAAAAVIYVVRMFLAAQKDWKNDIKGVVDSSNGVIERNTDALIEIKGVMQACKQKGEN